MSESLIKYVMKFYGVNREGAIKWIKENCPSYKESTRQGQMQPAKCGFFIAIKVNIEIDKNKGYY